MTVDRTLAFGRSLNPEAPTVTSFSRDELHIVLATYGRMVSEGRWGDYAISHLERTAVFSVFRHARRHPLYRIEKQPCLRHRQALYQIVGMDGRIFRRGNDLRHVMRFFEARMLKVVT